MRARLNLLGAVAFERPDGVVVDVGAVPTVKAMDLLRLLAGARGVSCADHYVTQLWPCADGSHGRGSLRTATAQLRKVLGPDVLSRSGDLICLGEVQTDIAELRELSAQVDLARRSGRHREVFTLVHEVIRSCPGDLVVSGSSCDAVYELRDELRELRRRMLLDGAAACARMGWMRESLEFAQLADAQSRTEASVRALMVAWSGLGETRSAIDAFEQLRAQLAEDYGVQPSPRSRALYLQVVTAGEEQPPHPPEHHLGVAAEVAALVRRLGGGPSPGGIVWLHGEPGSGRDEVARLACRLAETADARSPRAVEVLPEMVSLDPADVLRLRAEAREGQCVLLVPIRAELDADARRGEAVVEIERLDRHEFHALLCQLLQDRPAPNLETRLWTLTGGLAGQACRAVRQMVREGDLAWTTNGMDLAGRRSVRTLRRQPRHEVGIRALAAPLLVELGRYLAAAETALPMFAA